VYLFYLFGTPTIWCICFIYLEHYPYGVFVLFIRNTYNLSMQFKRLSHNKYIFTNYSQTLERQMKYIF